VLKSQLVLRLAVQHPRLNQRYVKKAVNTIFDEIISAMANRERVELRGFGAFSVKVAEAHAGRNPKTGTKVNVPERAIARFRPAKEMCRRLNSAGQNPAPSEQPTAE
jgi:integration host factor subunit beta